jgi:glyoxylase-like metal-dependent hydrolase (beta-lactamase superfamily II)
MKIGRIQINRVGDLEDARVPTDRGFPLLTREMLQHYLKILGPRYVDSVTLDLIMSFHTFVLRVDGRVILIETCVGNGKKRTVPAWHMRQGDYLGNLAAIGIKPEDVDVVMCTHLHVDHVGWNTRLINGRWIPTFPNARYVMAENEYRQWMDEYQRGSNAGPVTTGSPVVAGAFADSVLPVVESGQVELVKSDHRLESGVYLEAAPGHTPGHVMIHIEDGPDHAVCTGDIIHHPFQFTCPEMPTAYCEDPQLAVRTRLALLERYANTRSRIFTAHFIAPSAGRILRDGKLYRFEFEDV